MSTWFGQFNADLSSSKTWFNEWRQDAQNIFKEQGMPHSKQEAWKYAPLKQLYAQDLHEKNQGSYQKSALNLNAHFILCKNQKTFLDGLGSLPKGVVVLPLVEAIDKYPEIIRAHLGHIAKNRHGFITLNSGLFQAGVFIYIPADVVLDKPIVIEHHSEQGVICHSRNLVIGEPGSKMLLMEYFDSHDEHLGFINQVTELFLAESAVCQHFKLQNLSSAAFLQSEMFVQQEQMSQLETFLLQLGGHYASCDAVVKFAGEQASASLGGVFKAKRQQIHQQRLNIEHAKPHCHSSQNFRGILDEHAHGIFIGQVLVDQDAMKTKAHQSNKNLLLSKYAQMTTCPQLEIFADDVICSHGATVGQLDEDALFYLQARGLKQEFAKDLLVNAFVKKPIDNMSSEVFKACCMEYLSKK
jgi:Fe-S cluster assembly protein SufD